MNMVCIGFGQHYGVGASPPTPVPRLHGERIVDGLLFGEASRIGSTPPSRVMTVGTPLAPPSVATIMTASPFCRSASVMGGMRLIACCKSPEPPPAPILPIPPEPDPPEAEPLGLVDGSESAAEPALPVVGVVEGASAGVPFRRAAIDRKSVV